MTSQKDHLLEQEQELEQPQVEEQPSVVGVVLGDGCIEAFLNISIPITNYRNCYLQQLGEGQEQEQEVEIE